MLAVVFSIGSQASYVQKSATALQAVDGGFEPSPTPFFYDPNDTGKVLITVNCGEGGSVTPNGKAVVVRGTDITFVFTPNEGYEVDKVTIANGDEEATEVILTSYEHTEVGIDNNITLNVTFKAINNSVEVLKKVYSSDETIEVKAMGDRMNITTNLTYGSSRWRPVGYNLNGSDEIAILNPDISLEEPWSWRLPASDLRLGNHTMKVVFARQIYFEGEGWMYQRPVGFYSNDPLSLSSSKHGKMKLAADMEEDLTLPFVQDDYVADVRTYDFEVVPSATSVPTAVPTSEPTMIAPTTAPTVAPTISSTAEPTADPIVTPTPKPDATDDEDNDTGSSEDNDGARSSKKSDSPKTGDNSRFILWIIFAIIASIGVVSAGTTTRRKTR